MNDLTVFKNESFGEIRTLEINGEPWFVGKDVATILGYAKPLNALATHVDEGDLLKYGLSDSMGRTQKTIIINESGLYSLIESCRTISSNKKKDFISWLNSLGFLNSVTFYERREIRFREKIEQALKPFGIIIHKQYPCLQYNIDLYIESLKIAIEYDENEHKFYSYENQELRQKNIEKELSCRFIRVSDKNSDEYNIGYVIKNIFNLEEDI